MGQFNLENYAIEAKQIWGDLYEYVSTKRNEKNGKIMVGIICHKKDEYGREHGLFWKTPSKHKSGQGCPICSGGHHMTTEYLIDTSKLSHTSPIDNLSYEKTKFIKYDTNVTVTCHNKNENGEEHGDFSISPNHLIKGQGCPICRYIKSSYSKRKSFEETLKAIKIIHPLYDYSESEKTYVDRNSIMKVICHEKYKNGEEHGAFNMIPNNTLNPYLHCGCPKCGREKCDNSRKLSFDEFTDKANKRHNNAYIYHNDESFEKREKNTKIKITCKIHGDFYQTISNHLYGQGCPICKTSKLEQELANFLINKNIEYESQKKFNWLENKRLDFYLPKYHIAIECQGSQHFIKDHFFEPLEIIQERDKLKKQLCEEHGIKLLYYSNLGIEYPYQVFEDKEELLKEIINEELTKLCENEQY